VQSKVAGTSISRQFRMQVSQAIEEGVESFTFTDVDGEEMIYELVYDAANEMWSVKRGTETLVYDSYSFPSKEHLLGTDKNGMDMMTRLMYGGRIS